MVKSRVPMQVAPTFEQGVKQIQKRIMKKQGEKISLRDLTEYIEKNIDVDKLEKAILNKSKIDIRIRLDRRSTWENH